MRCKLLNIPPRSSNDNWHVPLFFPGMNWCSSVGNKNPLKGLHSLSSGNNWIGWCYAILLIWIWLTQGTVTHPAMTLAVTKKRKWKALCNLHVDLHVQLFLTWRQVAILHVFQPYRLIHNLLCKMIFFVGYEVIWCHMTSKHTPYWIRHLTFVGFTTFPGSQENDWSVSHLLSFFAFSADQSMKR